VLINEFHLQARDLGLLSGGYFFGFGLMQLPNGDWIDKYGPRKIILVLMAIAFLGCLAFSFSSNFIYLLASRTLIGVGVSACLMAPLTAFRKWYSKEEFQRCYSLMLMAGSTGILASTLPVQWLLTIVGWRKVSLVIAILVLLSFLLVLVFIPNWKNIHEEKYEKMNIIESYLPVLKDSYFKSIILIGFFNYGGFLAVQTLWAAPWLIKVSGYTEMQTAVGLFWLNLAMLLTYLLTSFINPYISKKGIGDEKLINYGLPLSFFTLLITIIFAQSSGWVHWTLFCIFSIVSTFAQIGIMLHFPNTIYGKASSAFNLTVFLGVFAIQWGIGLIIDLLKFLKFSEVASYQGAFSVFLICLIGSYLYFQKHKIKI